MNTSTILDDPILDDVTPELQPTQKFIDKSIQKIKDFGNWLLVYIPPKPDVVDEALESYKNLIKTVQQETHPSERVQFSIEQVCDTVSIRWKRLV